MLHYRKPEELCPQIIRWIRETINKTGSSGAVLGISGGIDSAVLSVLLAKALSSKNVLGVIMPCHSIDLDEELALKLTSKFGIPTVKVDLTKTYDDISKTIYTALPHDKISSLALANIKPRLRMTALYALAQTKGYVVCGGSNRDELMYGYFTKHGDSGVDMLPLANLLKGEVYLLAEYLGINEEIINRAPSAGLWDGQTDEEEIGLTYNELDEYLMTGNLENTEHKKKIEKAIRNTSHKRCYPIMPNIE